MPSTASKSWIGVIVAKLVCCGALLALVTGTVALGGIGGWLAGSIAVAAMSVVIALLVGMARRQAHIKRENDG